MNCKICGAPAKQKCTRCGGLFCVQHIRYGNPHFALWSPSGSTGYYCDNCWDLYRKEGERARLFFWAFIGIVVAIWLLVSCFLISNFASVIMRMR